MSLKKLKVAVAPASTKKETVPTVAIKAVIAKTPEGTFIGPVIQETPEHIIINTASGQQTVLKNDEAVIRPLVEAFNDASTRADEAEAAVKELEPHLKLMGVSFITSHNCGTPLDQWTSVKLEDHAGEKTRVSSTQRYPYANGDLVGACFESLKAASPQPDSNDARAVEAHEEKYDVNRYVQETVAASFDNKFFLDEKGNFSKARYDAVFAAMDVVAKKLSVTNPLSCKTIVQPKPEFHSKRYQVFSADENAKIHAVLPNTVSISANVK
jgi:hypothetical protein